MKKQIFLVVTIAIFGFTAFLASCKKEQIVEEKSCTCKMYTLDGQYLGTDDWGKPSEWDAKNCSDLQAQFNMMGVDLDRKFQCY